MINLTPVASTKVKEIMQMQNPVPVALRVAVVFSTTWRLRMRPTIPTKWSISTD
jgi:hypothetical protein